MAASKEGLIDNINCKLTAGGLTDIQASQLAGAAQALCCSSFYAVPCEACLPNAALNKGRFIYVQNIEKYRYSNGFTWTNNFCTVQSINLYTWGYNFNGQLGDGSTTSRCSPGTVSGGGTTWCSVSAGGCHSSAVKTDGTLWTWGLNTNGQLGDGTASARSSPGTVAGAGTTWKNVANGRFFSTAIKTDGTLWTWGNNGYGQLGDGTTTNRSSPGTVAGGGTTWCASNASVRGDFTVALKTDGTLWTWGANTRGQLGDGTLTNRCSPDTVAGGGTTWCAASAGRCHALAIKTDGTLWTWGYNLNGQLGDGSTTSRTSPGTVAGGGNNWCGVAAPNLNSIGIKSDGTVWTWGSGSFGVLGTGGVTGRSSPGTTAGGGTNWCKIAAGGDQGFGVKTDGTLWAWGCNSFGALGDGTVTSQTSPVTTVGAIKDWSVISSGGGHTIGVKIVCPGF